MKVHRLRAHQASRKIFTDWYQLGWRAEDPCCTAAGLKMLPEAIFASLDKQFPDNNFVALRIGGQICGAPSGSFGAPSWDRTQEMKILLVEDDFVTRFIMKRLCEQLGHACVAVEDGEGCLEEVTGNAASYAMILLDIHMPRLSGVEVVSELRASALEGIKTMPVIAVTADDIWQDTRRCVENGFSGVIAKPVTADGLARVFRDHVGAP